MRGLIKKPGCNFIAAAGLCNLVSGLSVSLCKPAVTTKTVIDKGVPKTVNLGSGDLFKALLIDYYPWEGVPDAADKATAVYKFLRNPLAHALGEDNKPGYVIRIEKSREKKPGSGTHRGWTERELTRLEKATKRPKGLKVGIEGAGKKWTFRVEGFYWGLLRLLAKLAADALQMTAAEARFAGGKFVWHT